VWIMNMLPSPTVDENVQQKRDAQDARRIGTEGSASCRQSKIAKTKD
ncbi:MAG: hypothetical protein ACI8RD_007853, partial [Bacillariaceae sp.]|jgi:hypothetical protein